MAPPVAELTPARRAVAAAMVFLAAGALAGISPQDQVTAYRVFGLTEGMLALLLTFVLLEREAWTRPAGPLGWLAIGYATVASAQIVTLLLPSRGLLQWLCVVGVLFLLLAGLAIVSRRRLMGLLSGLAVLLALLKFSVVPFLWEHSGPARGEAFGMGTALDRMRRLVVDYRPEAPGAQLLGVAAIALWVVGTRLLWREGSNEDDWLASAPESVRRRLAPGRD